MRLVFDSVNGDYEARVYNLKLDTWEKVEKVPLLFLKVSKPSFANGSTSWIVRKTTVKSYIFTSYPLSWNRGVSISVIT